MSRGLAGAVLLLGCSQRPAPVEPEPDPEPAATRVDDNVALQASAPNEPADGKVDEAAEIEPITGIPSCDAYLDLYKHCEKRLEPEIMSGERRFYRTERASLEQMLTTPARDALPESCDAMLRELRPHCSG